MWTATRRTRRLGRHRVTRRARRSHAARASTLARRPRNEGPSRGASRRSPRATWTPRPPPRWRRRRLGARRVQLRSPRRVARLPSCGASSRRPAAPQSRARQPGCGSPPRARARTPRAGRRRAAPRAGARRRARQEAARGACSVTAARSRAATSATDTSRSSGPSVPTFVTPVFSLLIILERKVCSVRSAVDRFGCLATSSRVTRAKGAASDGVRLRHANGDANGDDGGDDP